MNARTKLLVVFAVLFILGIYTIIDSGKDSRAMAKGMMDINKISVSNIKEGDFVQGTVLQLEDEFAYEEETRSSYGIKVSERVSAHYYVMPLFGSVSEGSDSIQLAAVKIGNTEAAAIADTMVRETYDYYADGTEPEMWTSFDMTGKIVPMDDDIMGYFREWADDYFPEGVFSYDCICPYVIEWRVPEAASNLMTTGAVMLCVGAVGLTVIIMLILKERKAAAMASAEDCSANKSSDMSDSDSSLGIGIGDEDR